MARRRLVPFIALFSVFRSPVFPLCFLLSAARFLSPLAAEELVYLDKDGVIRWAADKSEVSLFGANYSLPSACDYRAAGYIGADRRKLVEKDMAHFARMGWDGLRLCFWGDWENSDKQGNLIVNDHLDILDYCVFQAKQRGIYILFTPITTYSAWWPDGKPGDDYPGFSKFYDRAELCVNPAAIAAQSNYVWQIMQHVNPYTGAALKDEPGILFVEMINEPIHRSRDVPGSIAYINTLADAVLSTGCKKLLFHNISQDFGLTPAIKGSRVQGVTFAWYPTGLNANHTLIGNYLRTVDDYPPMLAPPLRNLPRVVYEFDSPDLNTGCLYPAMARTFRSVGAQFVAMFSYDMLDTAAYNLGWQTHFLNLVYSPRKAVSASIAAEAARSLPRYAEYGSYPDNCRFGPFRVSYEQDTSEMATDETFMHANDTKTRPPKPEALRKIVGLGSSPLVSYEGCGIYFLDRLTDGVWRLELYPDAVLVQDPFSQRLNYKTVCSRLVRRERPMKLDLPDLGGSFSVAGLNPGNKLSAKAKQGQFAATPGVFLLCRSALPAFESLPKKLGGVGLAEFHCPEPPALSAQIIPHLQAAYCVDRPINVHAEVVDSKPPAAVVFHARVVGQEKFRSWPLSPGGGFGYRAAIPAGTFNGEAIECFFTSRTEKDEVRFPSDPATYLTAKLLHAGVPIALFDAAATNPPHMTYTRIGDGVRHGIFQNRRATETDPAALRLFFPLSYDRALDDYSTSVVIRDSIREAAPLLAGAQALRLKARGAVPGLQIHITLVEADGTSRSRPLTLSTNWQEQVLPVADLKPGSGVKLPLGFPGRWNYWLSPAKGRGTAGDRLRLEAVEHLQISFRPERTAPQTKGDAWADISSVALAPR